MSLQQRSFNKTFEVYYISMAVVLAAFRSHAVICALTCDDLNLYWNISEKHIHWAVKFFVQFCIRVNMKLLLIKSKQKRMPLDFFRFMLINGHLQSFNHELIEFNIKLIGLALNLFYVLGMTSHLTANWNRQRSFFILFERKKNVRYSRFFCHFALECKWGKCLLNGWVKFANLWLSKFSDRFACMI